MTDQKNPLETLREALAEYDPIVQFNKHEEVLTLRVESSEERWGYISDAVTKMLTAHAIADRGTCGGAVESYPLVDGRVFHVVWIGTEEGGSPGAIFDISPRTKAW